MFSSIFHLAHTFHKHLFHVSLNFPHHLSPSISTLPQFSFYLTWISPNLSLLCSFCSLAHTFHKFPFHVSFHFPRHLSQLIYSLPVFPCHLLIMFVIPSLLHFFPLLILSAIFSTYLILLITFAISFSLQFSYHIILHFRLPQLIFFSCYPSHFLQAIKLQVWLGKNPSKFPRDTWVKYCTKHMTPQASWRVCRNKFELRKKRNTKNTPSIVNCF